MRGTERTIDIRGVAAISPHSASRNQRQLYSGYVRLDHTSPKSFP
jgi:hypothetical protein